MNRRDILRAAAVAPFVFGLEGCSRPPSWFNQALRKMRAEGKPGLVFRLPQDPKVRCRIGHGIAWIVEREDVDGLEVTGQALILCLEDADVRGLLFGARDGEDLLLIDADGTVLDGRRLDEQSDLTDLAGRLLDGPKLERLKARAAAAEKAAPPEALAAFKDLKEGVEPTAARRWAEPLLPMLALLNREIVNSGAEPAIVSLKGTPAPLPYGASLATGASVKCRENPACLNGTCGPCGMAVMTSRTREFVKFLAK